MKKKNLLSAFVLTFALIAGTSVFAQKSAKDTKMVGGAAMYPSKNIVENAVNSKDHTTLENKAALQGVLTYHVVAGKFSAADVIGAIEKSNGTATFNTVSGGKLMAKLKDGKVQLIDENGRTAFVTIADVNQSNGVIHVIDSVVLPKS